jgi:hypothetical protein
MPVRVPGVKQLLAALLISLLSTAVFAKGWSPLGDGVSGGEVLAIAYNKNSGAVYAGGTFTSASGVTGTSYLAKWDGHNWSSLGSGVNGSVAALAIDSSGNLYVVGAFTSAGNVANTSYLAMWDGTNWNALGSGVSGSVQAIAIDIHDVLYAAGTFTSAGGVLNTTKLVKWIGNTWSTVPITSTSDITALATDDAGNLFVAGLINTKPGTVGKWDGTSWTVLPHPFCTQWAGSRGCLTNPFALVLTASGTGKVAIASYYQYYLNGTTRYNQVASWDGTTWNLRYTDTSLSYASLNTVAIDGNGMLYIGRSPYVGTSLMSLGVTGYKTYLLGETPELFDYWTSAPRVNHIKAITGDQLIVAGAFSKLNGVAMNGIAWWDPQGDFDLDNVLDVADNCPYQPNTYQGDMDGDGIANECDDDADGDGAFNSSDTDDDNDAVADTSDCYPFDNSQSACPGGYYATGYGNRRALSGYYAVNGVLSSCASGTYQPDTGQNSCLTSTVVENCAVYSTTENACSACVTHYQLSGNQCNLIDADSDGITDALDNCPLVTNNDQVNTDGDVSGDVCDSDDDNDLMPDTWETTYGFNPLINDANGDADNDGLTNVQEYNNGSNPIVARTKNDYNADGIAGWIWKGQSNGVETQSQNWQLTFPLYSPNWGVPNRFYTPVFPDQANWEIVTSGDFNKDGDADILWRNLATAEWKVWQMQNGLRTAQNTPADFDLAHEWTVIGAGDTDKDGDDDVIFNKATSGEVLVWEMQDHAIANTHAVGTKAGYALNRIGDFNKDGDVDLLFRQNSADVLVTWEIEANAFVLERALANTGTNYQPVCAGDFDNDNDDDIMLVNSSTMQEKWFEMENYARLSQKFGATNTGFVFKGCGDYDGDGDADMLWQRSADDANRVVLQQSWGAIKQTVYTNAFGGVNPSAAGYGFVYRGNSN